MIWLVELSSSDTTLHGRASGQVIMWLAPSRAPRCLVEGDDDTAMALRGEPHVARIERAPDDLYVDTTTRTVWEVFNRGGAVRLVGYVPP